MEGGRQLSLILGTLPGVREFLALLWLFGADGQVTSVLWETLGWREPAQLSLGLRSQCSPGPQSWS